MAKNKKRDPRYTKSRAVKNSAKKAAAAAVLKRQQLKEAKEREAGNKEPSIDTDTGHEAQNNVEESVASEEPVEEPDEGKKKKAQDADLKGCSSPPEKRRRMTRSTAKVGCSSDGQVTDDEVTRYFARKKIGLTNAKLRHRGPRISKGHPSMAPKKTMKNQKGKTFLKDKRYLSLLEFKRSVTSSLLFYGLNAEKARKEDAPEARLMKEIPLSAEPGAKRRKDRLSVPDEIRFSQKRNCFLEFHDDRILDPTKAAAETVLAVDPEEEIAVQTVETDPLGIYPSSDSSDDSDFDALNNDVNDGVLLDEDEWVK
ncbi:hypothetical protein DAPPUDRAFT_118226 [Daphnia pulex]|uniref:Uncharacterized protein n=1 Tax=Daphnia pulex TaxID=6669 RepID=E9HV38_DAPPU|nr:hypothetical protein DAPPUDRAFT_118226 [Daphnia pulex]|eukprot:EFX64391.1 hypothetical protein DAPPUDRAFT_118226 [Daphnia pulex]